MAATSKWEDFLWGCLSVLFLVVVVFVLFFLLVFACQDNKPKDYKADFKLTCLSSWDGGSHSFLVHYIKKYYLVDPDSFQHISTDWYIKPDKSVHPSERIVKLTMKFRSKNGFGGYVVNTVVAESELECKITDYKFL